MRVARFDAPAGHRWAGLTPLIVERGEGFIATQIGTFLRKAGAWVHCADSRVRLVCKDSGE